jgi:quinol monooxygenase YgiN
VAVSEPGELALPLARQTGDNHRMADAPELYIFARFHARPGLESGMAEALLDVIGPTRQEPGCLGVHAFRSLRDPRLFYIHSRWRDEEAFELHATLPHTVRFLERVEPVIDHALDIARTRRIG